MSKEDIKKQIRTAFDHRVAVRVYNDQEISHDDMDFILDTAWLSPSSIGLEAWRFVVLDRKQIEKLRDELKAVAWGAQYQLDTASHFVLLIAEKNARYDSESVKNSLIRRGLGEDDALNSRLATYESFQKNDMKMADNLILFFDSLYESGIRVIVLDNFSFCEEESKRLFKYIFNNYIIDFFFKIKCRY